MRPLSEKSIVTTLRVGYMTRGWKSAVILTKHWNTPATSSYRPNNLLTPKECGELCGDILYKMYTLYTTYKLMFY